VRIRLIIATLGIALSAAFTVGLSSAGTALAATSAASSPSAAAAAPAASDPCKGRSDTYIVTRFIRGPEVFPLRCGTTTWGYNHIVYRDHNYNPALIALTLARGSQPIPGQQVLQYRWSSTTCPTYNFTYTVVYNQGALNGTKVRPQGIITAYESVTVSGDPAAAHATPKCG
jgi:ABC-type antimicrobial peptide transport system permease subunit